MTNPSIITKNTNVAKTKKKNTDHNHFCGLLEKMFDILKSVKLEKCKGYCINLNVF